MDKQRQDDQLEPIYNSYMLMRDIALKTSRERWTIETGGKRGSGRSMLAARRWRWGLISFFFYYSTNSRFFNPFHLKWKACGMKISPTWFFNPKFYTYSSGNLTYWSNLVHSFSNWQVLTFKNLWTIFWSSQN